MINTQIIQFEHKLINKFISENNFDKLNEESEYLINNYDICNEFSNINDENYLTFSDNYIIENLKNNIIETSQNFLHSHYIEVNSSNSEENTAANEEITQDEEANIENENNTLKNIIENNDITENKPNINNNKIIEQEKITTKNSNDISKDNNILLISEKIKKIYLPYTITELNNYIENYPNSYSSLKDVVEKEFILPFNYFNKHPSKSRFKETFNLLRNRDCLVNGLIGTISYSFKLLNKHNLNPAIIAACKSKYELDSYLYYLDSNKLDKFKLFKIIYEVNPL